MMHLFRVSSARGTLMTIQLSRWTPYLPSSPKFAEKPCWDTLQVTIQFRCTSTRTLNSGSRTVWLARLREVLQVSQRIALRKRLRLHSEWTTRGRVCKRAIWSKVSVSQMTCSSLHRAKVISQSLPNGSVLRRIDWRGKRMWGYSACIQID